MTRRCVIPHPSHVVACMLIGRICLVAGTCSIIVLVSFECQTQPPIKNPCQSNKQTQSSPYALRLSLLLLLSTAPSSDHEYDDNSSVGSVDSFGSFQWELRWTRGAAHYNDMRDSTGENSGDGGYGYLPQNLPKKAPSALSQDVSRICGGGVKDACETVSARRPRVAVGDKGGEGVFFN